jgi:hypothetical protein
MKKKLTPPKKMVDPLCIKKIWKEISPLAVPRG